MKIFFSNRWKMVLQCYKRLLVLYTKGNSVTVGVLQRCYKVLQNPYAKRPKTYFQNSILGIQTT